LPDLPLAGRRGRRRGLARAGRVGGEGYRDDDRLPLHAEDVAAGRALDRDPGLGDPAVIELVLGLALLTADVHRALAPCALQEPLTLPQDATPNDSFAYAASLASSRSTCSSAGRSPSSLAAIQLVVPPLKPSSGRAPR